VGNGTCQQYEKNPLYCKINNPSAGSGRQRFGYHAEFVEASFTALRYRLNALSNKRDSKYVRTYNIDVVKKKSEFRRLYFKIRFIVK